MEVFIERRHSNPDTLRNLWECIDAIRKQKQIANIKRITRYMEREYLYSHKQVLLALHKGIKDQMIVETISVGVKGSMAGVEQEGYWIPTGDSFPESVGDHDWYCFICHNAGKVKTCSQCFRVFHANCINTNYCDRNWKCQYCCTTIENISINKEDLNESFACMLSHLPKNSALQSKPTEDQYPYYDVFVFKYMDLDMLMSMCDGNEINSCNEFIGLLKLIEHNCHVAFGETHELTKYIVDVLEQCEHELSELLLCQNCFILSSTKLTKDWFTNPCDPPHKVVWAKQKGFDYWPAKLLQVRLENETADCRFFGGHHQRAWVELSQIKGITMPPSRLNIKRTNGWYKAVSEMKEYIRKCEYKLGKYTAEMVINFYPEELIGRKSLKKKPGDIKRVVWVDKHGLSDSKGTLWPAIITQEKEHRGTNTCSVMFFGSNNEKIVLRNNVHNTLKYEAPQNNQPWFKAVKEAKRYLNLTKMMVEIPLGNNYKNNELVSRKRKRKAELDSNKINCVDLKDEPMNLNEYNISTRNYDNKSTINCEDNVGKYLLDIMGEKAKLHEECARSWPYASEAISIGYFKLFEFYEFCKNNDLQRHKKELSKSKLSDKTSEASSQGELFLIEDESSQELQYETLIEKYKSALEKENIKQLKSLQLIMAKQILQERKFSTKKVFDYEIETTEQ